MEYSKVKAEKELARRQARVDFWTFCLLMDYNFFKSRENVLKPVADMLTKAYFSNKEHIKINIAMPPRIGKTYILHMFTSWCLGINPDREIIRATYSLDLSRQLHKTVREIISSHKFKYIFGHKLPEIDIENAELLQFKGYFRPNLIATSVGGATTGMGASITILDDAYKDMNEALSDSVNNKTKTWYKTALATRLDSKSGESKLEIIVGTSWQIEDLASTLEQQGYFDEVKKIAAIVDGKSFNEKIYTTQYLKDRMILLSPSEFQAMYQQQPVLADNALLSPDTIKWVNYGDYDAYARVIMIDSKSTGDDFFVALCTAITNIGLVAEDAIHTQDILDDLLENRLIRFIKHYQPLKVFIEVNKDYSLYRILKKRLPEIRFIPFYSKENKLEKIQMNARYIPRYHFISDGDAEYQSFMYQLMRFDANAKNKHDDAPDTIIMQIIKFLEIKSLGGKQWLT